MKPANSKYLITAQEMPGFYGSVGLYHKRSFKAKNHILVSYEQWMFKYMKYTVDKET